MVLPLRVESGNSHDTRLDFFLASTYVRMVLIPYLYAHLSVAGVSTPGFVLSLSWLNSVTAGHTKRVGAPSNTELLPK